MSVERLRYELKLMGKRVLLTPPLVMLCYTLFSVLLHYLRVDPARFLSSSLEMILPLAAGIVVATIISHDFAIELQLTAPALYRWTAFARLLLIAAWTMCIALLSSIVLSAVHLGYVPGQQHPLPAPLPFLIDQLTWFANVAWFVAVGLCLALLTRSRTSAGALLAGIWLVEILFKDYLAAVNWLRPVLLFPTTLLALTGPLPQQLFNAWLTNRLEVLGTAVILLPLGWVLLHNTEGLLKGADEE